ncbi:4-hydroxy-3-methylbut-2-enyl diphosphate reductase [Mucilaginibacter sp. ZT4R22]|uniref:4-hydroxy-3-methylbut-2-enyl diphosphate reductase n=1 Tax=Mucilaginibacter pankratovii TaxID=2772110 RepID=A0ABR7WS21_9SPHI|nr:4-hydroxy-3-methylbut-2-enyl diphosphate reductase [Mucilaginibacter pankratovii]MBD1365101.1 4-hydroxy-3-methylbut-2-enyl diphosphate reductase [Mucilaginibacter pankratovii]
MLDLKIVIDGNSGFCFGVVYAIEMAEDLLAEQGYLYCLGDIVHNDEEVLRLQAKGLRIINYQEFLSLQNETVLIRAHGEPPSTYQTALKQNIRLIDASCPVVLKLQNRIKRSYDNGDNLYIFGKEGHAEVVGLKGQTNGEAVVFGSYNELDTVMLPQDITLYSQTTKSTTELYGIREKLQQRGVNVNLKDTICRQVSNRGDELTAFARQQDIILFVSGSKSSNGKMLYQVCREANPHCYFVSGTNDIQAGWFSPGQKVGICGATSTPMWLMQQVRDRLQML